MRESDAPVGSLANQSLAELTLDDLIADAGMIRLPAPRGPRGPRAAVDVTIPAPRSIRIPDATVSLVDGYAEYGV
jgi:hypothetical protein